MNTFRLLLFLVAILGFMTLAHTSKRLDIMNKTQSVKGTKETDSFFMAFIYPEANPIQEDMYVSADDPQTIVDWYKKAFSTNGMHVENARLSLTNGNVSHTLVARNEKDAISVVVTKKKDNPETNIQISAK